MTNETDKLFTKYSVNETHSEPREGPGNKPGSSWEGPIPGGKEGKGKGKDGPGQKEGP